MLISKVATKFFLINIFIEINVFMIISIYHE